MNIRKVPRISVALLTLGAAACGEKKPENTDSNFNNRHDEDDASTDNQPDASSNEAITAESLAEITCHGYSICYEGYTNSSEEYKYCVMYYTAFFELLLDNHVDCGDELEAYAKCVDSYYCGDVESCDTEEITLSDCLGIDEDDT